MLVQAVLVALSICGGSPKKPCPCPDDTLAAVYMRAYDQGVLDQKTNDAMWRAGPGVTRWIVDRAPGRRPGGNPRAAVTWRGWNNASGRWVDSTYDANGRCLYAGGPVVQLPPPARWGDSVSVSGRGAVLYLRAAPDTPRHTVARKSRRASAGRRVQGATSAPSIVATVRDTFAPAGGADTTEWVPVGKWDRTAPPPGDVMPQGFGGATMNPEAGGQPGRPQVDDGGRRGRSSSLSAGCQPRASWWKKAIVVTVVGFGIGRATSSGGSSRVIRIGPPPTPPPDEPCDPHHPRGHHRGWVR